MEFFKKDKNINSTMHSEICCEKNDAIGINNFVVFEKNNESNILAAIHFQDAPVQESGVNGVFNEDLLNIVLIRLKEFQKGELACNFNEKAIEHIELALKELNLRTKDRIDRGVEGQYKK